MAYTNNPTAYRLEGLDRRWQDNSDSDSDPESYYFRTKCTSIDEREIYNEDHREKVRPTLSPLLPSSRYFPKNTSSGSTALETQDPDSRLNVLSLNIAGRKDNLDNLREHLSNQKPPIDVLLLCEASLRPKETLSIPGYVYEEAPRPKSEGGGVLVALSTRFMRSYLPVTLKGINFALEYIVVEFKDVAFVSIYRPPQSAKNSPTNFLKSFRSMVLDKLDLSKAIIIAGDMNIDLGNKNKSTVKKECNSTVQKFHQMLKEFGLNAFNTSETNPKTKTTNDFVATNIRDSKGWVEQEDISDHWPIVSYFPHESNVTS